MKENVFGSHLFSRMQSGMNYDCILENLVKDGSVETIQEAESNLDAFLQWIALAPSVDRSKAYVMLKCPIDDVFHAFIHNEDFYKSFCNRFLGFEIHHHPIGEYPIENIDDGVRFTVDQLEKHYKDSLHPALKEWRNLLDTEAYVVSCARHCPDTDEVTGHMGSTVMGDLATGGHIVH